METFTRMRPHSFRSCLLLICCASLIGFPAGNLLAATGIQDEGTKSELRFLTPQTPALSHQNSDRKAVSQRGLESERLPTPSIQHISFHELPDGLLQEGLELEHNGLWGEALSFYQQSLKEHPDSQQLKQRRAMARIHYDVHRRYADASFVRTITEASGTKALNVYAEVLLKIQSYYVDQPNWNQIAGYGLTSVEVALHTPEFRDRNLPGVSDSSVKNAILETREVLRSYPAGNRHEIYVIASTAAKALQNKIGLSPQATVYEFICGAISALDPYSAFMSSNQYDETMSQIEGNFVGLGVELRTQGDVLEIVGVIPNGSAGKGGIVKGDRIIQVDTYRVAEIGSERAADLLRGTEGSFVNLILDRGGVAIDTQLERKRVEIPSVSEVAIVDAAHGVGYIRVTNFQKTTARDFDSALWKLHRQGMQSLIVDVRGNPGGLLTASVELADRFVGSGVIVSTRGRNPMEDYIHRAQMASTWRVPLVVLVDEDSASASEIFAAAIRDHRRGTIVGRRSYGKGSVQGIFPLNVSGGGVRLTTAKFYSPTGQAISQVGVKADVIVRQTAKPADVEPLTTDDDLRVGIRTAIGAATRRQQAKRQATSGRG